MSYKDYTEGDLLKDKDGNDLKLFDLDYTEMVYIAPGKFKMGENQEHEIDFSKGALKDGYFMGKYPVTQELYEAVIGENPSKFKGKHRPVEMVSWNDICEGENSFLTKLNQKIKEEYGEIDTFSLPSEAQWEYAAAGGRQWNESILEFAGSNKLEDVGWFNKNSNKQTMPVGLKQPNALGLHDMSGNVFESCLDYWTNDITTLPKSGDPNPQRSDFRTLRGGSYFFGRHGCRLRDRGHTRPDSRDRNFGLRLCFSPVHPAN
jgi:sulfatase modifying factor 1